MLFSYIHPDIVNHILTLYLCYEDITELFLYCDQRRFQIINKEGLECDYKLCEKENCKQKNVEYWYFDKELIYTCIRHSNIPTLEVRCDCMGLRHGFNLHDNGTDRILECYKHGLKHGWSLCYHKGVLQEKCTYHFNKLNGQYQSYYSNGKLDVLCNYNMGLLEGEYTKYSPSGNVIESAYYVDGKKDGIYKTCNYQTEKLLSVELYMLGSKEGTHYVFYEDGHTIKKLTSWKENVKDGVCKEFYSDGSVMEEYTYKLDELHGLSRIYDMNGKCVLKRNYLNNNLHGKHICVSSNGGKTITEYKNGKAHGSNKIYNASGKLILHRIYIDGIFICDN
jgi:antitoxin component YwqK of YwqJK toxin-antitoxin module